MSDTGPTKSFGGSGSLLAVGNNLQTIAQSIIQAVIRLSRMAPDLTSGQLNANTLVLAGFVRVTGVSVVVANATPGFLYDAPTIAAAGAGNSVFTLPATAGYTATQLIFKQGLVYKPASGEKIALFYTGS